MKTVILLIPLLVLLGCASTGHNFDSRKVTTIQKGETTEADLVVMFGKPSYRTISSETGVKLAWIYVESTADAASYVPLVGAFAGGVTSKTKTLNVSLDQSGKVSSYEYSGGGVDSSGLAGTDPETGPQQAASTKTGHH